MPFFEWLPYHAFPLPPPQKIQLFIFYLFHWALNTAQNLQVHLIVFMYLNYHHLEDPQTERLKLAHTKLYVSKFLVVMIESEI